ncbi:MAG: class I SAM-dependent methyltransferase [Oculatellaceae cyanobacterium bins.114]|nr:class I SAM-dependent methyltransferase [Oculatellaceae cyanobacterium bins.114]
MSVQDAYNHWSTTYDTDINLTRDLDQAVTRKTLSDSRFQSVIELGCGTGKNTLFLAEIAETVHAMDFSANMLQRAREKIESTLETNNVVFSVADITQSWAYDDQSIDLIVCNLVLEHIEDLSFIFSEATRCLVKGGRFFVCELHPFRQYQGKKANFQKGQETVEISAFVHHISDFFNAGQQNGLQLNQLKEWWHTHDHNSLPRLISFVFEK